LKDQRGEFNLERIQKVFWSQMKISVSEFPRSMFTVRASNDSTRWSQGQIHPEMTQYELKLKYPAEFISSIKSCQISNLSDTMNDIQKYDWRS
jgi:hypothetical protein